MDELLTADVLAVCNTLGCTLDNQYCLDPQCLDSVKDLILHLRRSETPQHDVRRLLGEAQILQKDLIPIFMSDKCKDELTEVVLRLMVNLTTPPLDLYEHGIPKSKVDRNHFMTIIGHLQTYKEAYIQEKFWVAIFNKLKKLITDMDVLLENQKMTVERILALIQNILQVPADPREEMRNDDDASVHDQVLWALHSSGVMDLLLFVAASDSTKEFSTYALQIITLILREHSGEQLAKAQVVRSEEERRQDVQELTQTLHAEKVMQSRKRMSGRSFGGTFVIRGLQAASGREQICHKPVHSVAELSLDNMKKTRKTPVNRRQIVEPNNARRSTLTVRLLLKEFCVEFLLHAYNNLMKTVKVRLDRSRGQDNEETYYLIAMRFFMEFNRFYKFRLELVSETLDKPTFHYVQGLVERYHDLMRTDKDNVILWGKRAHTALRAYQELLSSLHAMEKTPANREQAQLIEGTVFYLPEYRELCVSLLASYESGKLSRNYLCDLVDTNHLFLKMLENFSKERPILVAGRKRIKRRRSTKNKKSDSSRKSSKRMKNTEESWVRVEDKLTEFLSSAFELEQAFPFDAASDTPIDEQKVFALNRIATHVSLEEYGKAVSLLRAAKEVWPDDNQLSMETEISSLKSIFLQATLLPGAKPPAEPSDDDEEEDNGELGDDDEDEIDDDDETQARASASESEFDFRGFLEKYAVVKIVSNLANLLKDFEELSPLTLHAILKMFHRYAFEMGYPAFLCQATLFHTFQEILKVAEIRPQLKDAEKFIYHFWGKFVKLAESNPKIFIEILFWKSSREAQEIQEGYAQYGDNNSTSARTKKPKNSRKILTLEEDNEIEVLAKEYNALADKEMKQISWINERLINGPKVKKVLTSFLTERGLLFQGRISRKAGGTKKKVVVKLKPYAPSANGSSDREEKSKADDSTSESDANDGGSSSVPSGSRNGQREESSDDDALVEELFAGLRKNSERERGVQVSSPATSPTASSGGSKSDKQSDTSLNNRKEPRHRIIVQEDSSDDEDREETIEEEGPNPVTVNTSDNAPISNGKQSTGAVTGNGDLMPEDVAQMLDEIDHEMEAEPLEAHVPHVNGTNEELVQRSTSNGDVIRVETPAEDVDLEEETPKSGKRKAHIIYFDSESE